MPQDPYNEGYAAFGRGGPNPHEFGSPEFNFWRWGWEQAGYDEEEYYYDLEDDE